MMLHTCQQGCKVVATAALVTSIRDTLSLHRRASQIVIVKSWTINLYISLCQW